MMSRIAHEVEKGLSYRTIRPPAMCRTPSAKPSTRLTKC